MDFDDLLDDSAPSSTQQPPKKKNWNDIASAKLVKALNDEDPFEDDDLWPVNKKKTAAPSAKSTYSAPKDDDDGWGVADTKKPAANLSFQKNSARGSNKSKQEEDEFDAMMDDIVGEKKPVAPAKLAHHHQA